ncbi:MAG: hypothetical protein ACKO9Z_18850, partial [Planctomycetota bacterium]
MPASRLSGPFRPRLEALESRENPATVTWDLAPSEITTDSGNKTRDTTLTYVADYSPAPSVTPTARSYTITNGRVISVTPDSTDSTIFYVDIAPKTGGR